MTQQAPTERLREYIAGVRERANAATEGPWKITKWKDEQGYPIEAEVSASTMSLHLSDADLWEDRWPEGIATADFIAASRTDIPTLLAICEKLMEAVTYYEDLRNGDDNGDKSREALSSCEQMLREK